jgi:hypothetical protein
MLENYISTVQRHRSNGRDAFVLPTHPPLMIKKKEKILPCTIQVIITPSATPLPCCRAASSPCAAAWTARLPSPSDAAVPCHGAWPAVMRVNTTNVQDEGLRIGGRGRWYVTNVSIIFDAPCLFYTNCYMFYLHFVTLLWFICTNLLIVAKVYNVLVLHFYV